ncbi:MAG: hypothetical protein QM607_01995 [Microbacterium sp.]
MAPQFLLSAGADSPAEESALLADETDAAMIVVGTRENGIRDSLHRQRRPVLAVPRHPVGPDEQLHWQDEN